MFAARGMPRRWAALGITLISLLAACGQNGGETVEPPAQTTADPEVDGGTVDPETAPATSEAGGLGEGIDDGTTITLWTRAATQTQSQALVDAYNAAHENQVDLTVIPTDDYQARIGAAAGSDDLPDLLSVDVVFAPNYTSSGLFADISDRIAALPFADDIAQSHIEVGTHEGRQYVVPHTMDLSVLFYNRDLYGQAGLDPDQPPATLEEFAEHARALDQLEGVDGTFFGGNCGGCLVFTWWPSLWADGAEVMDESGRESYLASEEAKAVYGVYRGLYEDDVVAAGTRDEAGPTWTGVFPEGNIGIMPMPSTTLGLMPEGLDVGVAPITGMNGGESTFVGGDSIGISANSQIPDQAWNFLAWTLGDEAQVEVLAKNSDVVARTDLASNRYSDEDPRLVTINEVAGQGRTPYAPKFGQTFNDPNGPWLPLVRAAVFDNADDAELQRLNEGVTASLQD